MYNIKSGEDFVLGKEFGLFSTYAIHRGKAKWPFLTVSIRQDKYHKFHENVLQSMLKSIDSYSILYKEINNTTRNPNIGSIMLKGDVDHYDVLVDYYYHLQTRVPPTDPKFFLLAFLVLKLDLINLNTDLLNILIEFAYGHIEFVSWDEAHKKPGSISYMQVIFGPPVISRDPVFGNEPSTSRILHYLYSSSLTLFSSFKTALDLIILGIIIDDIVRNYNYDAKFSDYSNTSVLYDKFNRSSISSIDFIYDLLYPVNYTNFFMDFANYNVSTVLGLARLTSKSNMGQLRGIDTKDSIPTLQNDDISFKLIDVVSSDKNLSTICYEVFYSYIKSVFYKSDKQPIIPLVRKLSEGLKPYNLF